MKKLLPLGLLLLLWSMLSAQGQAILSGSLNEFDLKVHLETVNTLSGDELLKKDISLDEDKKFKIKLELPPSNQFKLQLGNLILPLFLEEGDSLHVSLETVNKQLAVKYAGDGSSNNTFLFQFSLFEKKVGYEDLETALQQKDAEKYWEIAHKLEETKRSFFDRYTDRSQKPLSPSFTSYLQNQIKYKLVQELLVFPVYYSSMIQLKAVKLPPTYLTYLNELSLKEEDALECGSYQNALINWVNYKNTEIYDNSIEDQLKKLADNYKIAGDLYQDNTAHYAKFSLLKGLIRMDFVYGSYEYEDFIKSNAPQHLKDPIIRLFQIKSMKLEGFPMPDIQLIDKAGKTIHLSDLKGKIVYLGLWKNDTNTEAELASYFRLFGKKITENPKVSFSMVFATDNDRLWQQVLGRQKRNPSFLTHYKLDFSDNLTSNFALRTDEYGPLFVLIDENGVVVKENAHFQYGFNPNGRIRKMLKE